uniref:Uncharacterized protein n=1 Tax=Meloidogyne incognita TaxID=6306 RepID=A0A914LP28_MELIC
MIRGSLFRDFEFFQNIHAFNNWWAPQANNWENYWSIPRLNAVYWQCVEVAGCQCALRVIRLDNGTVDVAKRNEHEHGGMYILADGEDF